MIRRRVLAVDDEAGMQSFYHEFFDTVYRSEFIARIAGNGDEALKASRQEPFDLAVLDWTMPGMSGVEVARAMRADSRTKGMAILMVTVHAAPGDVCVALEAGADDHLGKPFDEKVMLARLRSLARRRELTREQNRVYRIEGLELDLGANRLLIDHREVHLKPKEMDVLKLLLERPDVVHRQSFLWDSIWGEESERWRFNLIDAIYGLRRKLGPRWGRRIRCHKGLGYSFASPCR